MEDTTKGFQKDVKAMPKKVRDVKAFIVGRCRLNLLDPR
jgi:hypothetical protein